MKKFLSFVLFSAFLLCVVTPCVGATQQDDTAAVQDSTLSVIGWFCKSDTAVYWIQDGGWKFIDGDTIKTAGVSRKVMLTVTDSTATGYKMDYTLLDVRCDTLEDSDLNNYQNKITALIGKKLVGTTISFETDEYGEIVKFNDLDNLKKKSKSLTKDVINEIEKLPSSMNLKNMGVDIRDFTKNIKDGDVTVDGYLQEIKMLFMCHGNVYNLGEITESNEAADTQYESETYCNVSIDEDECYSIMNETVTIIPKSDVKELVSEFVDNINNAKVKESFDEAYDSSDLDDCTKNSYVNISFLPNGWPYEVLSQDVTMIGSRGKARQKSIKLSSFTFGN
jgi:hypothetical protein